MEVEKLDQQITLELQNIDNNILEISNIITSKIQPIVSDFNAKFGNILENSTFHKQMFQTAGNLRDLSYMTVPQQGAVDKKKSLAAENRDALHTQGGTVGGDFASKTDPAAFAETHTQARNAEYTATSAQDQEGSLNINNTSDLFSHPPATTSTTSALAAASVNHHSQRPKTQATPDEIMKSLDTEFAGLVEEEEDLDNPDDSTIQKQKKRKKRKMSLRIYQQFADNSDEESYIPHPPTQTETVDESTREH